MLDSCSQGTFIKEALVHALGINAPRTSISVKTMNGEKRFSSMVVNGLIISSSISKLKKRWITLPKSYSQVDLPVDSEEVVTAGKLEKWKYLHCIKDEVCISDNADVGILIGANCGKALEPIKVISSQNGGPYAFQTLLGWCVVGPIQGTPKSGKDGFNCNRILVDNSESHDPAMHCFAVKEEVADIGITEMSQRLCLRDFNEPDLLGKNKSIIELDAEEISSNDMKFIKLMNQEVKQVDGHYQLPLPLKDPNIKLPNNRKQAERRLESIKWRFKRKRWRRVQHIANEFWSRWRKEFLSNLQARCKWNKVQRNFQEGDVVLLKEDSNHCEWPMARIVKTFPDRDSKVRSVLLVLSNKLNDKKSAVILNRPIHKLVLLVESDRFPDEEP